MAVSISLPIPGSTARIALASRPGPLAAYGHVTDFDYKDGPRVTITLRSGIRLTLVSEMDSWIAWSADSGETLGYEDLAAVCGRPDDPDGVNDALNEVWQAVAEITDELTRHVVSTVTAALPPVLDFWLAGPVLRQHATPADTADQDVDFTTSLSTSGEILARSVVDIEDTQ